VAGVSDFEFGPFAEGEKLGFRFCDRLHRSALEIDDSFFEDLRRFHSERQIIELAAVASAFEFFTRFVDALRIPTTPVLDPPGPPA
jgi:alkylhydroperoxidase family enzyme